MNYKVSWSKSIDKQLERIPSYIRDKFLAWVLVIERVGLEEVRKLSGYHDEPLKGERKGQRSVRLNRAYRVIYSEDKNGEIHIVNILEISKHEY